jgi:hypothetical protein
LRVPKDTQVIVDELPVASGYSTKRLGYELKSTAARNFKLKSKKEESYTDCPPKHSPSWAFRFKICLRFRWSGRYVLEIKLLWKQAVGMNHSLDNLTGLRYEGEESQLKIPIQSSPGESLADMVRLQTRARWWDCRDYHHC